MIDKQKPAYLNNIVLPEGGQELIDRFKNGLTDYYHLLLKKRETPSMPLEEALSMLEIYVTEIIGKKPTVNNEVDFVLDLWIPHSIDKKSAFRKRLTGTGYGFEVVIPSGESEDWHLGVLYKLGSNEGFAIPRYNMSILDFTIDKYYPQYTRGGRPIREITKLAKAEKDLASGGWKVKETGEFKF